jgi:hypothetical protein
VSLPLGFASLTLGAIDWSSVLTVLAWPVALAVFGMVWLTSHAINALILLSPWGGVDAVLKAARTALLGAVAVAPMLDNPWISGVLSLVIIFVSYCVAGWSFRLMVFGTIFCWQFLTRAKRRTRVGARANRLFSGPLMRALGVPVRTYGRLVHEPENGRLIFQYRPWLVLPRREVAVTLTQPEIGRGLFVSTLRDGADRGIVCVLPPRYRGHEEALAEAYEIARGVRPAGLRRIFGALGDLLVGGDAMELVDRPTAQP